MAVITAPDGVLVELIGPGAMSAMVTGGASGIGREVAGRLRDAGHDVVVWDLRRLPISLAMSAIPTR